ncbi:hypothetical protein BS78_02G241200 [Paspalum vaginatum]|nr:hypothetical protein BS78_02G241200 [Paspalum vaginatum]KAJ1290413.1 hypothetical protein BS78_02G241200 [Paspalum vaginatum]
MRSVATTLAVPTSLSCYSSLAPCCSAEAEPFHLTWATSTSPPPPRLFASALQALYTPSSLAYTSRKMPWPHLYKRDAVPALLQVPATAISSSPKTAASRRDVWPGDARHRTSLHAAGPSDPYHARVPWGSCHPVPRLCPTGPLHRSFSPTNQMIES